MYKFFGWLNVALVVVITAPWWLRKLNEWFFHSKARGYLQLQKVLRKLHKPLAAILLLSIVTHGLLVMGTLLKLNTGTLALVVFLLTAGIGLILWLAKKYKLLPWHKIGALAAVLLVVAHLIWPYIFGHV